jgi:hypothetical protein
MFWVHGLTPAQNEYGSTLTGNPAKGAVAIWHIRELPTVNLGCRCRDMQAVRGPAAPWYQPDGCHFVSVRGVAERADRIQGDYTVP